MYAFLLLFLEDRTEGVEKETDLFKPLTVRCIVVNYSIQYKSRKVNSNHAGAARYHPYLGVYPFQTEN